MKSLNCIVFFVLTIFLISACSENQNITASTTTITTITTLNTNNLGTGKESYKEFKITAKQFSFTPSDIIVNKGDKVKLIVTSIDVPHGISIPEYGINERLPVGEPVKIEFTADKEGTFTAFCSVFCGAGHSGMKGKLIVK